MLKPLQDRVIVKMIKNEETTKSGIILSGSSKDNSQLAEVIAVGKCKDINEKHEEIHLRKGEKVIIKKYSGTDVKYRGEDFIIVKQDDVLAVVE